jgi:hypothetical protein
MVYRLNQMWTLSLMGTLLQIGCLIFDISTRDSIELPVLRIDEQFNEASQ